MKCEQFQRALPRVIESGGNEAEEAHLHTCQSCSELVRDLKYIAEQAKLLLPMHDPNPRVWSSIQDSLAREGLIREGSRSATTPKKKSWTPLGLVLAALAVLTLAALLLNYRPTTPMSQITATPAAADSALLDADDEALMRQVSQQSPEVSRVYETGLKQANSYITDAKRVAHENPDDPLAQEQLKRAYAQKAMLYDMATSRALQ